jgi:hypothetical protein
LLFDYLKRKLARGPFANDGDVILAATAVGSQIPIETALYRDV